MKFLAKQFNNTNKSITVVIQDDNEKSFPLSIDAAHPKYNVLKEQYAKDDPDAFMRMYHAKEEQIKQEKIVKYIGDSGIILDGDKFYYNGLELHHVYCNRIIEMRNENMPIEPMIAFLSNLLKNPSNRSQQELPDFLANRNMPITEDGHFLAYKTVLDDWYSKASGSLTLESGKVREDGRIFNGVGEVIRCSRGEVDDERDNECSHGLHVGGLKYSGPGGWYNSSGDKVVIVKVNPADVVSVPKDHNAQKVRVCAYEVISEYVEPLCETCHDVEPMETEDTQIIDINKVSVADTITFQYPDHNGNIETRYVLVDDVQSDNLSGYVTENDPSYEIGEEYRRFKFSKIINPKTYWEDE